MTFNLFYVDHRDIAFFSAGQPADPGAGHEPEPPDARHGQYDWRGFLAPERASPGHEPEERHRELEREPGPGFGVSRQQLGAISRSSASTC